MLPSKLKKFYFAWFVTVITGVTLIASLNLLFSIKNPSWTALGIIFGLAPAAANAFVKDKKASKGVICEPEITKHYLFLLSFGMVVCLAILMALSN